MFEVVVQGQGWGGYVVRGTGRYAGQVAIFVGPEARERAEAYAQWLNGGAALQRRRNDPGFQGRADPER